MKFRLWTGICVGLLALGLVGSVRGAVTFSVVAKLGSSAPGYAPNGVIETGGVFYGTTAKGGSDGNGTIFKLTSTGTLTMLYAFTGGNDGATPQDSLVVGNDGALYGTATSKGAKSNGTFFRITTTGTFTTLHAFDGSLSGEGSAPPQLIKDANGNFYGACLLGGGDSTGGGSIVQITPTGSLTILHAFHTPTDGGFVNPQIVQGSDGAIYGSTQIGGTNGFGTLFRVTTGGAFSILAQLASSSDQPVITASGADGDLYGIDGVNTSAGYLFKMTKAGVRSTVYTFTHGTDGGGPNTFILASDGNFYGTTSFYGANSQGSFFQVTPDGTFSTLFALTPATRGFVGLIRGGDGNFYSTSASQGASGGGEVLEQTPTGTATVLQSFATPGSAPLAELLQASDGNFYGVTSFGGATNDGTLFSVTPGGVYTTLENFEFNTTGSRPESGLIEDTTTGSILGVALTGGALYEPVLNEGGVFFELSGSMASSHVSPAGIQPAFHVETWADHAKFYPPDSGARPQGKPKRSKPEYVYDPYHDTSAVHPSMRPALLRPAIVTGTTVAYYGVCSLGGALNGGTFYSCGADGTLTDLYDFGTVANEGTGPESTLIEDGSGNLYGTAGFGGASNMGTIFKITPVNGSIQSTLTTLHTFTGQNTTTPSASDGARPAANNLVLGPDGRIYGTTPAGGVTNQGTVFAMTTTGSMTILHSFSSSGTDGYNPQSGLILGADGKLYGTTLQGGDIGAGTIYSITTGGVETILHSFSGSDGSGPMASLIQANDGGFYGVTAYGGNGNGVIFRLAVDQGTQTQTINFPVIANQSSGAPPLTLNATASSGLPVTYLVSGPATVSGTKNNILTFIGSGTITVTAGQVGSATFAPAPEVTRSFAVGGAAPTPIPFATWETNNGISGAAPTAKIGDTTPIWLKYLCDIDPTSPMSAADRAALPAAVLDTTSTPGTQYLTVTYRQSATASDLNPILQQSTDLQTWTTVTPDISQTVAFDGNDPIMEMGITVTGPTKKFIRLQATAP